MIRLPWCSPSKNKPPAPVCQALDAGLQVSLSTAFCQGFLCALSVGGQQLTDAIREQATEEALTRLEPSVLQRAKDVGAISPQETLAIQAKQQEFADKLAQTHDSKYQHYLDALGWVLQQRDEHANGHELRSA